eukprot:scaffold121254_cov28-Tisochrysis_lutea.AAC.1
MATAVWLYMRGRRDSSSGDKGSCTTPSSDRSGGGPSPPGRTPSRATRSSAGSATASSVRAAPSARARQVASAHAISSGEERATMPQTMSASTSKVRLPAARADAAAAHATRAPPATSPARSMLCA